MKCDRKKCLTRSCEHESKPWVVFMQCNWTTRDHSSGSLGYSASIFPDPSLELCKERRAGVIMEMKYSMFALHMSAVFSLHKNFLHHAKTGNQKLPSSRSSLRCATWAETFFLPKAPTSCFTRKFSPSADNISNELPVNKIKVDPRKQFLFASIAYRVAGVCVSARFQLIK